jgi:hypothetical protein
MRKKESQRKQPSSVKYVREHYNQGVRKEVRAQLSTRKGEKGEVTNKGRRRKKQRVWTLNRSPHGNKTAREQFGRQIWQRSVERKREDGTYGLERRKKVIQGQKEYVKRKQVVRF